MLLPEGLNSRWYTPADKQRPDKKLHMLCSQNIAYGWWEKKTESINAQQ